MKNVFFFLFSITHIVKRRTKTLEYQRNSVYLKSCRISFFPHLNEKKKFKALSPKLLLQKRNEDAKLSTYS